jgi:hypothetical protein
MITGPVTGMVYRFDQIGRQAVVLSDAVELILAWRGAQGVTPNAPVEEATTGPYEVAELDDVQALDAVLRYKYER